MADCHFRELTLPTVPAVATLWISSNHGPLIGLWPMLISVVPVPTVQKRLVQPVVVEPLMGIGMEGTLLLQAIPPKEVRWVQPATMLSRMIVDIVDGITMMNTS